MTEKYPNAWAGLIAFATAFCLCGAIGMADSKHGATANGALTVTLFATFVGFAVYAALRWDLFPDD